MPVAMLIFAFVAGFFLQKASMATILRVVSYFNDYSLNGYLKNFCL